MTAQSSARQLQLTVDEHEHVAGAEAARIAEVRERLEKQVAESQLRADTLAEQVGRRRQGGGVCEVGKCSFFQSESVTLKFVFFLCLLLVLCISVLVSLCLCVWLSLSLSLTLSLTLSLILSHSRIFCCRYSMPLYS